MTMFSSYSSLTLQLLQIKKKKFKKSSCSHHFSTHREDFLHYVEPRALADRQGKRQTGSLFLRPFCDIPLRGSQKSNLLSPATKANTSDFSSTKEIPSRSMTTAQNFYYLLLKPTLFHLFGLLSNSKYCLYAPCKMPKECRCISLY